LISYLLIYHICKANINQLFLREQIRIFSWETNYYVSGVIRPLKRTILTNHMYQLYDVIYDKQVPQHNYKKHFLCEILCMQRRLENRINRPDNVHLFLLNIT
jgi:hypothetical protein